MHKPTADVQGDFDRVARAEEALGQRESPYVRWLAAHLPARIGEALEIGGGTGELTRLLAARASHVLALDLSPEMIRVARERSAGFSNAEFLVADVTAWELPRGRFDCVASVGTLHHLPLEPTVGAMRDALRPGGWLLVLDVLAGPGLRHLPRNVLAALAGRVGPHRTSRELRAAYREHGRGETYLRPDEVAARFLPLLPGARIRDHLLWRYSVVWRKPPGGLDWRGVIVEPSPGTRSCGWTRCASAGLRNLLPTHRQTCRTSRRSRSRSAGADWRAGSQSPP
ncbi:MAG TPA: class I SAM-dependent methyltransferase [Longimicrobium sp.]|jgi:SAM-dependent methyltransferase